MNTIAKILIIAVAGITLTIAQAQEDPTPAQVQESRAVLRKVEETVRPVLAHLNPAPQIEYPEHMQSLVIRYRPRKFLVHGRTKNGEWSPDAQEAIGPDSTGFILTIHLQRRGEVNQADTPQTLKEPYWQTFLEVTPIAGTTNQVYWALSSSGRTDVKLLDSVKQSLGSMAGSETKTGAGKPDGAAKGNEPEKNQTSPAAGSPR